MRGLEAKLKRWQESQLISPEQYERIIEFEHAQPHRSWVTFGTAAVGVIALMTGVISIIAANWDGIDPYSKLAAYFLIQTLIGLAVWKLRAADGLAREVLISIFALWILAGIGLIGQIFHLQSDGFQGLRAWLVMSLPIVLFARSSLINHLWLVGFIVATALWASPPPPRGLSNQELFYEATYRASVVGALIYALLALGLLRTDKISNWFRAAARNWALLVLLFPVAIAINLAWALDYDLKETYPLAHLALPLGGVALVLASLGLLPIGLRERPRWAPWLAGVVILSFLGAIIPLFLNITSSDFLGLLWFLGIWFCAAGAAAEADRKRLFDLATLVISLRLIIAYFELFGSLAATGIGLIVTGLVIIGIAMGWNKVRKLFLARRRSE